VRRLAVADWTRSVSAIRGAALSVSGGASGDYDVRGGG